MAYKKMNGTRYKINSTKRNYKKSNKNVANPYMKGSKPKKKNLKKFTLNEKRAYWMSVGAELQKENKINSKFLNMTDRQKDSVMRGISTVKNNKLRLFAKKK